MITIDALKQHYDFSACDANVKTTVANAMATPDSALRFIYRYAEWNGYFGSGVATLAGKVGRSRGLFMDPEYRTWLPQVADRGVMVAAYIFNAARDEFDDSSTDHADDHRTLAQAMVLGAVRYFYPENDTFDHMLDTMGTSPRDTAIATVMNTPIWLTGLCDQVAHGYGNGTPDDLASIYRAMGYHMGSEVLAEHEFTEIDRYLRAAYPELVTYLSNESIQFAGDEAHNAYLWLSIHSDLGGGVECDHFHDALRAIEHALKYTHPDHHDDLIQQVYLGFDDFARDHAFFFANVNKA